MGMIWCGNCRLSRTPVSPRFRTTHCRCCPIPTGPAVIRESVSAEYDTPLSAARPVISRSATLADPAPGQRRGERLVIRSQPRHLPAEPLDLPLQGFDLLGVPPLFHLVLRGQPFQGVRQLPFQPGQTAPSLSRQLHGRPIAPNPARIVRRAGRQHHDPLALDLPEHDPPGVQLQLSQRLPGLLDVQVQRRRAS